MTKRKRHYRDLSVDEPLPDEMRAEVLAEVEGKTPEQLKAMIEEGWFMNPGGHHRIRILKMFERNGLMRFTTNPDGSEVMQFADQMTRASHLNRHVASR
jgi:hypothetical protein